MAPQDPQLMAPPGPTADGSPGPTADGPPGPTVVGPPGPTVDEPTADGPPGPTAVGIVLSVMECRDRLVGEHVTTVGSRCPERFKGSFREGCVCFFQEL